MGQDLNRLGKGAAIFAITVSIGAFVLALLGGGLVYALADLLKFFGLSGGSEALAYPLGHWVFLIYVIGAGLGYAAFRWPQAAALAMLALGTIAFFFGGPIAGLFAVLIACAAVALLVASRRGSSA